MNAELSDYRCAPLRAAPTNQFAYGVSRPVRNAGVNMVAVGFGTRFFGLLKLPSPI